MKLVAFIVGIFFLHACGSSSEKEILIPISVQAFEKELMASNDFMKGKSTIVFVLNPSECGSCEKEILRLMKKDFSGVEKCFVIPYKMEINTSFQHRKIIQFQRRKLAEWGVLNANGSVLLIMDGACVFYKPIDIQRIDALIEEIRAYHN